LSARAGCAGCAGREILSLDRGWLFHLGDIDSPVPTDKHIAAYMANKAGWARGAARINYDDSDWRALDLPHDWSVEGEYDPKNYIDNGFLPRGIAWYRRHFALDESDRGKYLALRFDGVSSHCTVFVNGHVLHRNYCGYTPFTVDITDVARFGQEDVNVVAVRVDATPIEGWWYEGAGIYRHAWVIKTSPLRLALDGGVFVSTRRMEGDLWHTDVRLTVENGSYQKTECKIEFDVIDPDGVTVTKSSDQVSDIYPRRSKSTGDLLVVTAPKLWSPDTPTLYTLRVRLRPFDFKTGVAGNALLDEVSVPFGYRTIRFDADHGFFLNDQPLKLKGTCNHQDHAGVGVAVPDEIHEFRIRRLKEMGCNAYRCAHHPPAAELLDACDRLGMLVIDENRTFGSSPQHLEQLRAMVLRDRNHPSVILWSICNEEAIQGTPVAANIARAMQAEVKKLDPGDGGRLSIGKGGRPVTAAVSGGILNDDSIADAMQVMGINYQLPLNDQYHAKHPTVPVVAAETHCVLSTRGTYENDPERCHFASYDHDVAPWGATARETWRFVSSREYLAGLFAWTGFDYRGEPTPSTWPCVNSHFGVMDLCGFAKDAFFLHKAFWSEGPFVHILPHWNWPGRDGQTIRVMTYTNCREVELFLNGESLGRKKIDPVEMAEWSVPYRPGQLRAVGDDAEAIVETAGEPVALGLEVNPAANVNVRVLPITVFAVDDSGRRVPTAENPVRFDAKGGATILGVGNGDPSSHEPAKASSRRLFRGLAQVILQATTTPAEITLTATADGLGATTLTLKIPAIASAPSVPPARRRNFITDWRMSPISATAPDVRQDVIEQDMNSWERVEPGTPQRAWASARGFAIYRAEAKLPKSIESRGGEIVFHAIGGVADVYLNCRVRAKSASNSVRIPIAAGQSRLQLLILLRGDDASAGLSGKVELIAAG
jgi:beta-galactosidase